MGERDGRRRWWRHAEDTAGLLLRNEGRVYLYGDLRAGYRACHQAYPTEGGRIYNATRARAGWVAIPPALLATGWT